MERGTPGCTQVHEKIIHALTLKSLPPDSYDFSPLVPGYHFHQWMSLGPPLLLPIAETILCHRHGGVTVLRTDPDSGYVVHEHHPLAIEAKGFGEESDVDVQFVRKCLARVVGASVPLISLPSVYNLPLPKTATPLGQMQTQTQGGGEGGVATKRLHARCAVECIDVPADASSSYAHPTQHEKLQHRFVAVLKRPVFNPRSKYNPPATGHTIGKTTDKVANSNNSTTNVNRHNDSHPPGASGPPLLVANDTELLPPLAFQAHLLDAIYGKCVGGSASAHPTAAAVGESEKSGEGGEGGTGAGAGAGAGGARRAQALVQTHPPPVVILQQYVKPRGRGAGFYRVFWKKVPEDPSHM